MRITVGENMLSFHEDLTDKRGQRQPAYIKPRVDDKECNATKAIERERVR